MNIFEQVSTNTHEQVLFCYNKETNLKAIIAIHDTTLGPALGGCRMYPYKSEQDALTDVLRLSRAMTYKAAASGLNLGGGKTVIIGDPKRDKTEFLLRMLGKFINTIGGRYIAAEDVGTSVNDMMILRQETEHIVGIPTSRGGGGDPSIVTAFGVYKGLEACLGVRYGSTSLKDKTIAIQGVGNVGYHLAELIHKAGGRLIVTDIDNARLELAASEFQARIVSLDEIYSQKCNIFAPCAMGGTINNESIKMLNCDIVAGSANNQLLYSDAANLLLEKGIMYAPDFVINAGGLINVAEEICGYNRKSALENAAKIFDSVTEILRTSEKDAISSHQAAINLATYRINNIKQLHRIFSN